MGLFSVDGDFVCSDDFQDILNTIINMMHFCYAAVFLGGFNAGIADSNGVKNTGALGYAYFGCGSTVCCGCNRKLNVGVDRTCRVNSRAARDE